MGDGKASGRDPGEEIGGWPGVRESRWVGGEHVALYVEETDSENAAEPGGSEDLGKVIEGVGLKGLAGWGGWVFGQPGSGIEHGGFAGEGLAMELVSQPGVGNDENRPEHGQGEGD